MKIAICDDSPEAIEKVETELEKMSHKIFDYDVFFNGEELLAYAEKHGIKYNLYILDIEMEVMDGLQLAKRIRKIDSRALIVFLTSYSSYVYDVFEVVTFDFILKPISYEKLEVVIDKAKSYLQLTKQNFIFSYRQNQYIISCDEIIYIEKKGRQAMIYTEDENYHCNMTLLDIWNQLDQSVFTHVHSSIIVNLEYIREITKDDLYLKNGTNLFVSRTYKQELKEKHLYYLRGKV